MRVSLNYLLLVSPAALMIVVLFLYPLGFSLVAAFTSDAGALTLKHVAKVLSLYSNDILFTVFIVLVSVALLAVLYRLPLFIPFIVAAQMMRTFLAKNGLMYNMLVASDLVQLLDTISWLGWKGIIITFVWKQLAFATLLICGAMAALEPSQVLAVLVCLLISIPAGYALSRRSMPLRVMFMLLFLIPQAFPNLTVYMNIARLFYQWGLNGTVAGVVLVDSVHGLMYSIWICVAAFSAIDPLQARASRNLGAGSLFTFWHIVLPQASAGIMAAGIFVFLESLDEFTGTFFVGAPDITTLPLLLYNASMSGNYQVSSITALILLVPSLLFMLVIHKFMRPEMLSKMGK